MILYVYKSLWWIVLPWVLLFRWVKDRRSGNANHYLFERLGFSLATQPHDIMLHAVSLGEVRAITSLVRAILKKYPNCKVLVTTTTLTGREQLQQTFKKQISICFLPHDIGFFINRFLRKIQPKLVLILETEIWPNLIVEAEKLNIPVYIISACLSDRSFKGYRRFSRTIQNILKNVQVMTQTEKDAEHFSLLGVQNPIVMGNIKYNVTPPDDLDDIVAILSPKTQKIRITLASSHDDEEKLFLDVANQLNKKYPDICFAIAPRHPERFESVEHLIQSSGLTYQKRSNTEFKAFSSSSDVWYFDTIGELFYLYGVSDIIVLGGSFVPVGGHNILEPALLGKAIVIGEYYQTIDAIVSDFVAQNAIVISSRGELYYQLCALIESKYKRKTIGDNAMNAALRNQNTVSIVMSEIEKYLGGGL